MDGRGVSATDLQALCSRLAREYAFAARLNSGPAKPPPKRLDGHRALLPQLPRVAAREGGLPPLPTRLPLGRVQADRMAAGRGRQAPHVQRWRRAGAVHRLARAGDVSRRADQARAAVALFLSGLVASQAEKGHMAIEPPRCPTMRMCP